MKEERTISGFEVIGKRGARIKVFLDGAEWAELEAETVVREGLGRGDAVDAMRAKNILALDEIIRARKAAAGHTVRQPKTRRELERFLRGKGFSANAIGTALEQLEASGTIN